MARGTSGEKVLAEVPAVMPIFTAHATAWAYQASGATSMKGELAVLTVGLPMERHRKVTAWLRVTVLAGEKVLAEVPVVTCFCTAQVTASA